MNELVNVIVINMRDLLVEYIIKWMIQQRIPKLVVISQIQERCGLVNIEI